jgi:hypothetical protein
MHTHGKYLQTKELVQLDFALERSEKQQQKEVRDGSHLFV